jgi:hypothetical protein
MTLDTQLTAIYHQMQTSGHMPADTTLWQATPSQTEMPSLNGPMMKEAISSLCHTV